MATGCATLVTPAAGEAASFSREQGPGRGQPAGATASEREEAAATRTRHLEFYLALAETATRNIEGPEFREWLTRLEADRENLLFANSWCDQVPDGAECGMRLACATLRFWVASGLLLVGHRIALQALDRVGADERNALRARTLFVAGQLNRFLGDCDEANKNLLEALSIAEESEDKSTAGEVLRDLGLLSDRQGNAAEAVRHLNCALTLAHETDDKTSAAWAIGAFGAVRLADGDLTSAQACFEKVLTLMREQADYEGIAMVSLGLARVFILRGSGDRARGLLLDALDVSATAGSRWLEQAVLDGVAGVSTTTGDWAFAARMHGAAEAQFDEIRYRRERLEEMFLTWLTTQVRRAMGEPAYRDAFQRGYTLSLDEAVAEARGWLAGNQDHEGRFRSDV